MLVPTVDSKGTGGSERVVLVVVVVEAVLPVSASDFSREAKLGDPSSSQHRQSRFDACCDGSCGDEGTCDHGYNSVSSFPSTVRSKVTMKSKGREDSHHTSETTTVD